MTRSILDIVLEHAEANGVDRVLSIRLQIGALSHVEQEWIQWYFDHLSKHTIAEGAKIQVEKVPARARCESCSRVFVIDVGAAGGIRCPECHDRSCRLVSGTEYTLKDIEVQ